MNIDKKYICPSCAEEFDDGVLRCICGYEGEPILSTNKSGQQKKNTYKEKIKTEPVGGHADYSEILAKYSLAEEYMRKAEFEYQKSKNERIAAERLKEKLSDELQKYKKMNNRSINDPFEILGVHQSDSYELIKKTYRALISIYHPDKHHYGSVDSKKQKSDYIAKINEAYEKISQIHKKKNC